MISGKKGEVSPVIRMSIIVSSLIVAIFVVIVVIYNIIGSSIEEKKAEDAINLDFVKSSVVLKNDTIVLTLSGELGEKKLNRVKFFISDGSNEKEIILDASKFESGEKYFEINLKGLGIDYSKKLYVGVAPIIKTLTGEKILGITDKISISPEGDIEEDEEYLLSGITKCDECGGVFGGCSETKCHLIPEVCYYEGGLTKKCTSCDDMTCDKYGNEEDCVEDRCALNCEWKIESSGTGNVILNLFRTLTGKAISGSCTSKYSSSEGTSGGDEGTGEVDEGEVGENGEVDEGGGEEIEEGTLGYSCSLESECDSGFCVDGVCCDSSCTGTCKRCDLSGNEGTCSNSLIDTDPDNECSEITCTNYIYGWSGNSCYKYRESSSHNGMCDGTGSCYTSVIDSCSGKNAISASCGSTECEKACPEGALATNYDSVEEVCYTSGAQSCPTETYYWTNVQQINDAWVDVNYEPEYTPNCGESYLGGYGYFIESSRSGSLHIWSSYITSSGSGPIWKFRCDVEPTPLSCDATGTCS